MKLDEQELKRKAAEYLRGKTQEEKVIKDLLDKAQDDSEKEKAN